MTIYVLFMFFLQEEFKNQQDLLSNEIEKQQLDISRLHACVSTSVAFAAHMSHSSFPSDSHELIVKWDVLFTIVKWDVVTLNQGGAYDTSTGMFTCDTSGLYAFDVHVQGHFGTRVCLQLQKNGDRLVGLFKHAHDHTDDASLSHVVELQQGDEVGVFTSCTSVLYQEYVDELNYFSGYLIRSADCNTP